MTPMGLPQPAAADRQAGSGTAIGVAVMFPMLMLVIVALHSITAATHAEQSLQAIADRAAHAASLCCDDVASARTAVEQGIEASAAGGESAGLGCINDTVGDASIEFWDVSGNAVADHETTELGHIDLPNPVPPGGTVTVRVVCQLPSSSVGVFSLPRGDVFRTAIGMATVDPYRHRHTGIAP